MPKRGIEGNKINFFNSLDHLEPKCPQCGTKVDWGITTEYSDEHECHVCKECSFVFK